KEDIFILLFFISMTVSFFYSVNQNYAIEKWLKLLIAIIYYFFLKNMLIEKPEYFDKISKYASFALLPFLGLLGYYYLILFNTNYIGIELGYPTKSGKNSLAFM